VAIDSKPGFNANGEDERHPCAAKRQGRTQEKRCKANLPGNAGKPFNANAVIQLIGKGYLENYKTNSPTATFRRRLENDSKPILRGTLENDSKPILRGTLENDSKPIPSSR
jgi:hypothetical protein